MKLLLSVLLFFSTVSLSAEQPISTTTEQRGSEQSEAMSDASERVSAQSYSTDVWFHRLELELSGDINNNGFYHQLYLKFDADTNRSSQPVWAEFSLQRPGRAEQLFHISSIFTLYRQSRNDWFAIDTTLEESYPTDYYDLIIRLYDANSGWLVAEISGYDELILADLPLEDYRRDQQVLTVVESYGGSLGIFALFGLSLLLWRQQITRCK
ncbi:choice-of-anchor H family protein [Alkalimonas sp.]|uniref:choice-of-anchor H family protein n=1 Tax=Alkalimonas sp. TaxID=1872453 RepID=UPI00263AF7E0|nr:choice-of-anchor H family protein [Alkalimonas sp.]MCC5825574.1 choice-of-anchor H family protein [Alkalimonas sp.]